MAIIPMPLHINRYLANNIDPPRARQRSCSDFACIAAWAKNKPNTFPKISSSTKIANAREKVIPAITTIKVTAVSIASLLGSRCSTRLVSPPALPDAETGGSLPAKRMVLKVRELAKVGWKRIVSCGGQRGQLNTLEVGLKKPLSSRRVGYWWMRATLRNARRSERREAMCFFDNWLGQLPDLECDGSRALPETRSKKRQQHSLTDQKRTQHALGRNDLVPEQD